MLQFVSYKFIICLLSEHFLRKCTFCIINSILNFFLKISEPPLELFFIFYFQFEWYLLFLPHISHFPPFFRDALPWKHIVMFWFNVAQVVFGHWSNRKKLFWRITCRNTCIGWQIKWISESFLLWRHSSVLCALNNLLLKFILLW